MTSLPPVKRFESDGGVRIYRIPCQAFAHLDARVYLLLGAGPPTLVDSGSGVGDCTAHILDGLRRVASDFGESVTLGDVERLIITHGHIDHIGGAAELLRQMPAAELGIHPLDAGTIGQWAEHAVVAYRRLAAFLSEAGVPPAPRADLLAASRFDRQRIAPASISFELADGADLDGIRVLHTPGHSPGHVCLAVGRILLTADHVLAKTVPQQWPESFQPYTGLGHYLDSLAKVQAAGTFELALASHEQVIHDLPARIETIRTSQFRRLERLLDILRHADRPLTMYEITTRMYADAVQFRGFLAVTDVGARIEYLHQRGRVRVANLDELEQSPDAPPRFAAAESALHARFAG